MMILGTSVKVLCSIEHGQGVGQQRRHYTCFGHVSIFVISVQPICLPAPNQEFDGAEAIAMGWGAFEYKRGTGSKILKYVRLKVTHNRLRARAMFGTEISGTHRTNPSVKDVCSGDSGV